jgi:hypothetical protein
VSRRSDYILRQPNWGRVSDGPMPVRSHTGAGDMIVQAGLMVELSKKYGSIAVPCYDKYWELGKSLYVNHPDIYLYQLPSNHPGHLCSPPDDTFDYAQDIAGLDKSQQIGIGDYAGEGIWEDFAKGFYLQSGVGYRYRWDSCPIMNIIEEVTQIGDRHEVFVHDDPSRGHIITRLVDKSKCYIPRFTSNILMYARTLLFAKEIHVIDSAFFCLVNQLPVKGKLFYHHYARPDRPSDFRYDLKHEWNYVI